MEPLKPEVMVRQVEGLAGDLRALTRPFAQQIRTVLTPLEWRAVKKVYLTGDGDSYSLSHYDYNIKHRIYVEFNDCLMAI